MTDVELKQVYRAADSQEAHRLRQMLELEGIKTQIVGEHLQNALGDLPVFDVSPRLWVIEKDYLRARELLVEYENRRKKGPVQEATWKCSNCHETNEANFDLCWNCQTLYE